MRKILYALLTAITLNAQAMERPDFVTIDYGKSVVQHHPGLDNCDWVYDGTQFSILYDDEEYPVDPAFVDPLLRDISKDQLVELLAHGYLYVNRLDNGQFTIKAKIRGEGGIPPLLITFGFLGFYAGRAMVNRWIEGDPVIFADHVRQQAIPDRPVDDIQDAQERIIDQAIAQSAALRSEGNRVHVDPVPACVVGPGIPIPPISGITGGKGPFIRILPPANPDPTPTPTTPQPNFPKPTTPNPIHPNLPPIHDLPPLAPRTV